VTNSISAASARRIALAAQGFGRPRSGTVGTRQLNLVMDRLGLLQIDSVNVFERSHYLPVFARLGAYDKALLDHLTLRRGAPYIEGWAHVASFIPRDTWPLWRWRMEDARSAAEKPGWPKRSTLDALRAELAERGPLTAGQIEQEASKRKGSWWNWSDAKLGLEVLFLRGEVVPAGRRRFERVYALVDQVLPPAILQTEVPRVDAQRELVRRAVRSLGIGTLSDVADYYRLPVAVTKAALRDLVDAGEVTATAVAGWDGAAFLDPGARVPRRIEATALLSPFDPIVWERRRALRMFGFHYRIELYTPAPRRVYGYYTLPVLVDEALVGRIDLKSDRQSGVLRVQSAWREPDAPAGIEERLVPVLRETAAWQGLDDIVVVDRGDLARDLAAALRIPTTEAA
jgi:uncharacterized protein YcaQ